MNKKWCVAASALLLAAGANGYAQTKQIAKQALEEMTGKVPSAFSQSAKVALQRASLIGSRVMEAQFMLADPAYISSAELFKREAAANRFSHLPEQRVAVLAKSFAALDDLAAENNLGAFVNLRKNTTQLPDEVFFDANLRLMTDLLDVQAYMKLHQKEFPQLFAPEENGWTTVANGLDTPEGNVAFLKMLNILILEQYGKVSPAVIEQLVLLRQNASNPPSVKALVKSLEDWREAFPDAGEPKLPPALDGVNLWREAERLWLVTEIRLLQLTPDIELPEVLKNVNVIL